MSRHATSTPTPEAWDAFVRQHPRAHLLQTSAWANLKHAFGWEPVRVAITDTDHTSTDGTITAGAQLLFRKLPFRLGTLAYVPYGPLVDWHDPAAVDALLNAIDATARQHSAVFLKMEPGFALGAEAYLPDGGDFSAYGFRPSPQTVQPPRTYVLDLDADDDAIQARMNQGTPRNIRKSAKFEVEVREGTRADVASFNALIDETGSRNAFGVHTASYYERAYDLFVPQGNAALLIARHDGQDLAAVMVFTQGRWAWYLYGASSARERQRMASYGVQWAGIQWAKARGAIYYDMYGIPDAPEDQLEAQFADRDDGLWSVYRFKRGWGGDVIRSVGAWDRVYNRPLYAAYRWWAGRRPE